MRSERRQPKPDIRGLMVRLDNLMEGIARALPPGVMGVRLGGASLTRVEVLARARQALSPWR